MYFFLQGLAMYKTKTATLPLKYITLPKYVNCYLHWETHCIYSIWNYYQLFDQTHTYKIKIKFLQRQKSMFVFIYFLKYNLIIQLSREPDTREGRITCASVTWHLVFVSGFGVSLLLLQEGATSTSLRQVVLPTCWAVSVLNRTCRLIQVSTRWQKWSIETENGLQA